MADEVLTRRELNRTLLGRRRMAAADAVEHLVGMQAQNPLDPYFGLWSRLDDFDPEELSKLLASREAVRAWLMRGTIHLVTARDCLALRPVMDSVLRAALTAQQFGRDAAGMDRDELRAAAEEVLADEPTTRAELRGNLHPSPAPQGREHVVFQEPERGVVHPDVDGHRESSSRGVSVLA